MVRLFSAGDVYRNQRVAKRPSMGNRSPPPLTLKSRFTMLDSGEMSGSQDNPPTLASLRARRGKLRAGKGSPSPSPSPNSLRQTPLFSELSEIPPALHNRQADIATVPDESPIPSEKSQRKPTLTSSVPIERRIWSVRDLVTDIRQHVETSEVF